MATDGSIKVVGGDIEEQARNLADLKNELERVLNAANQQVKRLLEEEKFTGRSGESFQNLYDEWNTSSMKSVALLEDFGGYLGQASAAFTEVDQNFTLKI